MQLKHLRHLVCPACRGDLALGQVTRQGRERVEQGALNCPVCQKEYPIIGFIPRFVPAQNYAASFGLEWNRFARTQYDAASGAAISQDRFFSVTRWPRRLAGQTILEVGSGSGRFSEHAAATGAMVCSLDYSQAVEANYRSNGHLDNLLIVQGDIYQMPFRTGYFDKLFCFGVLQHTPDVRRAFMSLPAFLKPGGKLAVDIYELTWWTYLVKTRYWVRPFTRRMEPAKLMRLVERWVDFMWPLARRLSRIPLLGPNLNKALFIVDYSQDLPLPQDQLKLWATLDSFDWLSPAYDQPQSLATMRRWFREAGLVESDVHYGQNGIEGRGRRPPA